MTKNYDYTTVNFILNGQQRERVEKAARIFGHVKGKGSNLNRSAAIRWLIDLGLDVAEDIATSIDGAVQQVACK